MRTAKAISRPLSRATSAAGDDRYQSERGSGMRQRLRIRLYRPAWMDRHALVTALVNRQSAHWLAELLFTHQ